MLIFIKLLVYLLLWLLRKVFEYYFPGEECENIKYWMDWLAEGLFFNDWITITIETYIEFLIAGYFGIWFGPAELRYYGDYLSLVLSYSCLTLALIFFPCLIGLVWNKRSQALQSRRYTDYIGVLYDGYKTKHRRVPIYLLNLTVRRINCVAAGLFMRNSYWDGLSYCYVLIFVFMWPSTIVARLRIRRSRFENRVELANEWFIVSCAIISMSFTAIHTAEERLNYGWILTSSILLICILPHCCLIFYYSIVPLK